MRKIERKVHGVPLWLLKEYLEELGGKAQSDTKVTCEGWTATFERIENYTIGSLSIGRCRLEIEGSEEALDKLLPRLERKLTRGGG